MPLLVMSNAGDYFKEIVEPTVVEFQSTRSSFRTAFATATVLFHAHEWLWEFNRTDLEAAFGQTFPKRGDFWGFVQTQVPTAGYMRDVANASKHVRLTLRPSTGMSHVANTHVQTTGYGMGAYGAGRYGGRNLTMDDSGQSISFDQCVNDLLAFWRPLLLRLYP